MCLFLGARTTLSVTVLRTLLDKGVPIESALVAKGSGWRGNIDDIIPVYRPDNMESVCETAGVPLIEVDGVPSPDLIQESAGGVPDFIICVCFPRRLPESVSNLPLRGCLNLHPSLLPAYRGPAPTFWQLWAGESTSGVSLHHMSDRLDAGNILRQAVVEIPVGISARELDEKMGRKGAELMVQATRDSEDTGWAQDERAASDFSWPEEKDFEIHSTWSAERVFRFMRGTRELGKRYVLTINAERFLLGSALMYSPDEVLGKSYEKLGAEMRIQFSPGVVGVMIS